MSTQTRISNSKNNQSKIIQPTGFFEQFYDAISSWSIFGKLNALPIKKRLMVFFLLISIIPVSVLGIISYLSFKKAINQKISIYSSELVNQTALNVGIKMDSYEMIPLQLGNRQDLHNRISEFVRATSGYDRFVKGKEVTSIFDNIRNEHKSIYSIMLLNSRSKELDLYTGGSTKGGLQKEFRESMSYQDALKGDKKLLWRHELQDEKTGKSYLTLAKRAFDQDGRLLGQYVIVIPEEEFDKTINSTLNNYESGKRNYSIVVDENGKIVSSPIKDDLNRDIFTMISDASKLRGMVGGFALKCSFKTKFKGKSVLVYGVPVSGKNWYVLSIAPTDYLYQSANQVGMITVLLIGFFGLIAIFSAIIVTYGISTPLNQMVEMMKQAENGDFRGRISITARDEFGNLAASYNTMMEKNGRLLSEIKGAIATVMQRSSVLTENSTQSAESATAVSEAMGQISEGTIYQAKEAEECAKKMSEFSQQIDLVVIKASEVERITDFTKDLSFQSKQVINTLTQKVSETGQITKSIIEGINNLSNSTDDVQRITDIISEIAQQANILALNTAVEAARLGNQSFSSVAEGINKLAGQSQLAVNSINNLMQALISRIQEYSHIAMLANQGIDEQLISISGAQSSFDDILNATDNVIHRIYDVNRMIMQMNAIKNESMQSIVNIYSVCEETAAAAQEVYASSEQEMNVANQIKVLSGELNNLAKRLVETVSQFRNC